MHGLSRRLRRTAKAMKSGVRGPAPMTGDKRSRKQRIPQRGLMDRYSSLLPAGKAVAVVVLASDESRHEALEYLRTLSGETVHVIGPEASPEWEIGGLDMVHHPAGSLARVHWVLSSIGPVDLIVNLLQRTSRKHEDFWAKLFFHLQPGGAYVIDRRAIQAEDGERAAGDQLLPRISAVAKLTGRPVKDLPQAPKRRRELALSTREVLFGTDHIIVTKRNRHLLKLRDDEASRLLPTRDRSTTLRVLKTMPGAAFTSRARVISHESAVPIAGLNERLDYPTMHLRAYEGRIGLVSNQLVFAGSSILPESFRHHLRDNPSNVRVIDANQDFARVPPHLHPRRTLRGSYYLLDSENSGHFGHIMTDVVSRLWGWDEAKRTIPDLKALFRVRFPNERDPALERRIFAAYGIPEEDVVWVDEPVWLESAVGATPMWHNAPTQYVHPGIAEVWERLGRAIISEDLPAAERIFISRTSSSKYRECRNIRDVEKIFAAHGFEIVYPEFLDLSQQAGLFSRATVVAGFGGSGLFNVMFAKNLSTLIVLNQESYTARNEHLFSSVLGCETHYFWSTPDLSHPSGVWSREAYRSAWDFDFDRNRGSLEDVFGSL